MKVTEQIAERLARGYWGSGTNLPLGMLRVSRKDVDVLLGMVAEAEKALAACYMLSDRPAITNICDKALDIIRAEGAE